MESKIFINEAINDGYLLYLEEQEEMRTPLFLADVIRALVLMYGEEVVTCFMKRESDTFKNILLQYAYPIEEYEQFLENIENYYKYAIGQKDRPIKKKNKYFNLVQKSLIDMLLCKNNVEVVSVKDKKMFYSLLYTARSKDFNRVSYALLMAYNAYEIDDYFKKQKFLIGE